MEGRLNDFEPLDEPLYDTLELEPLNTEYLLPFGIPLGPSFGAGPPLLLLPYDPPLEVLLCE